MKISYAIPVCDEYKEIKYLLDYLFKHKREQDEIVVQCDKGNTTQDVYTVLQEFSTYYSVGFKVVEFPLNGNFAAFKNNLKDNCSGDYIFQIDADELVEKYFIDLLPQVLGQNDVDVILVPRINTVEGLTPEHIQKWGWRVDENNWINFPDFQWRIYKNHPNIKWKNKVHEVLEGYETLSHFPQSPEWCILHPKTIERQEKQNNYYNTL